MLQDQCGHRSFLYNRRVGLPAWTVLFGQGNVALVSREQQHCLRSMHIFEQYVHVIDPFFLLEHRTREQALQSMMSAEHAAKLI